MRRLMRTMITTRRFPSFKTSLQPLGSTAARVRSPPPLPSFQRHHRRFPSDNFKALLQDQSFNIWAPPPLVSGLHRRCLLSNAATVASLPTGSYLSDLTMKTLCDQAPRTPSNAVRPILENELGKTIDEVFETFDWDPIGSASIAQVHRARLKGDKKDIVVKVQHPGV